MKITLNKEYTEKHQEQMVKDAMREFKNTFTDGDLLREFIQQTDNWNVSGQIIKCEVDAFAAGWAEPNYGGADFEVKIWVDCCIKVYSICYYADQNCNISTALSTVKEYKMV